jgi:hypothetical protein
MIRVSRMEQTGLSKDGRSALLQFAVSGQQPIVLEFSTNELAKIVQELGSVLLEARQRSELSKQGLVPIERPPQSRGALSDDGTTVIVSFRLDNGLEHHYGLEPKHAEELSTQIRDAAEQGKRTMPVKGH